MRPLAIALFVAFAASPASAADKNEDKAKEAAVAFLKAVKAKGRGRGDEGLRPVRPPRRGDISVIRTRPNSKWIKGKLDDLKDADKVPTDRKRSFRSPT